MNGRWDPAIILYGFQPSPFAKATEGHGRWNDKKGAGMTKRLE